MTRPAFPILPLVTAWNEHFHFAKRDDVGIPLFEPDREGAA